MKGEVVETAVKKIRIVEEAEIVERTEMTEIIERKRIEKVEGKVRT